MEDTGGSEHFYIYIFFFLIVILELTQLFESRLHFAQNAHPPFPQCDVFVQIHTDRTGRRLTLLFQLFLGFVEQLDQMQIQRFLTAI